MHPICNNTDQVLSTGRYLHFSISLNAYTKSHQTFCCVHVKIMIMPLMKEWLGAKITCVHVVIYYNNKSVETIIQLIHMFMLQKKCNTATQA